MANDNSSTLCLYDTIEVALHALAENQTSPPTPKELAKMWHERLSLSKAVSPLGWYEP